MCVCYKKTWCLFSKCVHALEKHRHDEYYDKCTWTCFNHWCQPVSHPFKLFPDAACRLVNELQEIVIWSWFWRYWAAGTTVAHFSFGTIALIEDTSEATNTGCSHVDACSSLKVQGILFQIVHHRDYPETPIQSRLLMQGAWRRGLSGPGTAATCLCKAQPSGSETATQCNAHSQASKSGVDSGPGEGLHLQKRLSRGHIELSSSVDLSQLWMSAPSSHASEPHAHSRGAQSPGCLRSAWLQGLWSLLCMEGMQRPRLHCRLQNICS